MHDLRRPDHVAAPGGADALVAEADAEDRDASGGPADDRGRHAGILGPAGPRADEDGVGLEGGGLVGRDGVVAVDDWLGPELAQVLDEVVDERVVVVDDEDTGGHGPVP